MKYIIIVASVLCLFSCDSINKLTEFEYSINDQVTIPSSIPLQLPFSINSPDVETNSTATFESNDTRKDLIKEIKLIELVLSVEQPDEQDFSFLESIGVFISADDLPEVELASQQTVDMNSRSIQLETTGTDFTEYLSKERIDIRVNTITDELITQDIGIDMDITFLVSASPL